MYVDTTGRCSMIEALRREGARGPWLGLLRELFRLGGSGTHFLRHAERPWSSTTFSGARHTFHLMFEGEDAVAGGERLIAALPDHEFALPGRLVADATIMEAEHSLVDEPRLTIAAELLVLDDT
jgi:hypothetical protein